MGRNCLCYHKLPFHILLVERRVRPLDQSVWAACRAPPPSNSHTNIKRLVVNREV